MEVEKCVEKGILFYRSGEKKSGRRSGERERGNAGAGAGVCPPMRARALLMTEVLIFVDTLCFMKGFSFCIISFREKKDGKGPLFYIFCRSFIVVIITC